MVHGFALGFKAINDNLLLPISQVGTKPVINDTSKSIVIKFTQENFMVDCVEGFLKINKYMPHVT